MHVHRLPLEVTRSFTPFFLDYISQQPALAPFYNRFPVIENFEAQIQEKKLAFPPAHRTALGQALQKQYQNLNLNLNPGSVVAANLLALQSENTFTVTTGHQLNIFTGPLYFIFKIVTVINACKQLAQKYPNYRFVPVYWMASEDHDYEEIRSFRLFGKKYTWETAQRGAVGRFSPDGLADMARELPAAAKFFAEAYQKNNTLAGAARHYVHHLFQDDGLVVIDGDDAALKALFAPAAARDLFEHESHRHVTETNRQLQALGYQPQVFSRPVNLFYLDDAVRARIEREGDQFYAVGAGLCWQQNEVQALLQSRPECFSPNVILRPLYQELILPNLAYCGGPAELVYWLQLRGVFDAARVPFPILLPRQFGMVLPPPIEAKWMKTGMDWADLFQEKNFLHNQWMARHSGLALSLTAELEATQQLFESIRTRALAIDKALEPMVAAGHTRTRRTVEKTEQKLLRAAKRRQQEKLAQIDAVKDALFPGGSLQERTENILTFLAEDPAFTDRLRAHFDPFDFRFNILTYS
jgi:bacillithiol biosynthesis cysteine-adding enzyme BshC